MYYLSRLLTATTILNNVYCSKPNIVLVLTDDQDLVLDSLVSMKKTVNLIGSKGAAFMNAFSTTPVCCPSRASILTGLYQHNHGVMNNSLNGNCNGLNWQNIKEKETFAASLSEIGYNTFYCGKYLNQYGTKKSGGVSHVPKGWNSWVGLVGNSVYYNYTLSVNGSQKYFPDQYLTNVIESYSLEFLEDQKHSKNPFLMVLAPPAPHHPFTPEEKYKDAFKGRKIPRNEQFNYARNSDKHWLLRMQPSPLPEELINDLDEMHAHRWETLLSVDDLVSAVVKKIDNIGKINETYIMFTSDHGFHLGQFSLPWDKRQPYDFDLRVPFLIRGPGILPKTVIETPLLLIDIAPTILHIAGISNNHTDGSSFLPIRKTGRTFLIEYQGEGNEKSNHGCPWKDENLYGCSIEAHCKCQDAKNNTYQCIRGFGDGNDYIFCKFYDSKDFREYYNMSVDPLELNNGAGLLSENLLHKLENSLEKMSLCKGLNCFQPDSAWAFEGARC